MVDILYTYSRLEREVKYPIPFLVPHEPFTPKPATSPQQLLGLSSQIELSQLKMPFVYFNRIEVAQFLKS